MFGQPAPKSAWYVACRSSDLGRKPRPVLVHSIPFVVWRDASGAVHAFVDRCPHRNTPLSIGKVFSDRLRCKYHGWEFNSNGRCVHIPGLSGDAGGKGQNATSALAREQDGYIWLYGGEDATDTVPFRFPNLPNADYSVVRYRARFQAPLFYVLENFLDVPHTAFLHRQLFRSGEPRKISARVKRSSGRVEIEYIGEPRPSGLAARLLDPSQGVVTHVDRFLWPSIAQIEYRLGNSHVLATTALTPVTEDETMAYTTILFRLRIPKILVIPFAAPLFYLILRQDQRITAQQSANVKRFGGEKFSSTPADLIGPQILSLWKSDGSTTADEIVTELSL